MAIDVSQLTASALTQTVSVEVSQLTFSALTQTTLIVVSQLTLSALSDGSLPPYGGTSSRRRQAMVGSF